MRCGLPWQTTQRTWRGVRGAWCRGRRRFRRRTGDGAEQGGVRNVAAKPILARAGDCVEHRVGKPHQIPDCVPPIYQLGGNDRAIVVAVRDVGVAGEGRVKAGRHGQAFCKSFSIRIFFVSSFSRYSNWVLVFDEQGHLISRPLLAIAARRRLRIAGAALTNARQSIPIMKEEAPEPFQIKGAHA